MEKNNSVQIFEILDSLIENPQSELRFSNELELLIAVMLSAQCTDKRVNVVTEKLFKKYKTPSDYANADLSELEEYIKSCNYYHNKAKNIINACKKIVLDYNGIIPNTHDELMTLPGVGNKTANVVEAVAFGKQALAVDTHILRVSNRLGLVKTNNPTNCEKMLKDIFVGQDYNKLHHLLLLFGRYYCTARSPKCDNCVLRGKCKYIDLKENL